MEAATTTAITIDFFAARGHVYTIYIAISTGTTCINARTEAVLSKLN